MRKVFAMVALGSLAILGPQAVPMARADGTVTAAQAATFYLHGSQPAGEASAPDALLDGAFMPMDANAPVDAQPKSMQVVNYLIGPNTHCAPNALFPAWSGQVSGQVVGDLTFTFDAAALVVTTAPGVSGPYLLVRLWPDASAGCNDAYVEPASQALVHLGAGQQTVSVTLPNPDGFSVEESMSVGISSVEGGPGTWTSPYVARILYDGAGNASNLKFSYCAAPVDPAAPCQLAPALVVL